LGKGPGEQKRLGKGDKKGGGHHNNTTLTDEIRTCLTVSLEEEEVFIWRISRIYSEIVATTDAHPYAFLPFSGISRDPPVGKAFVSVFTS
jgi:hypothetical protein